MEIQDFHYCYGGCRWIENTFDVFKYMEFIPILEGGGHFDSN